jgi:hypothetical protein
MAGDSHAIRFAFYGRTARLAAADAEAERHWQQQCCREAVATRGGQIITWFFDGACRADMPLASRPQGRALLAALVDPDRCIDAVVITDPARLLPRQAAPNASVTGWPGTLLLLANADLVIGSRQEYDLAAGILIGRPPRRRPAPLPVAASLTAAGRRLPGRGRHGTKACDDTRG